MIIVMNNEKKIKKKLENELKTTNEYLKKYTTPSSNTGIDIIAEAMKKGKVKSGSRFYKDDDEFSNSSHSLNNSSHEMGYVLGSSTHSHGSETETETETDLDGSWNGNTNRVILGRYADQDKVSSKQRFTTEYREKFRLNRIHPIG